MLDYKQNNTRPDACASCVDVDLSDADEGGSLRIEATEAVKDENIRVRIRSAAAAGGGNSANSRVRLSEVVVTSSRTCETIEVDASGRAGSSDAKQANTATSGSSSGDSSGRTDRLLQSGSGTDGGSSSGSSGDSGKDGTGTGRFSDLPEDLRARIPDRCNPVSNDAPENVKEYCMNLIRQLY